ncbi:hypothetical protein [Thermococcus thioreducens]|uniref:Uncharacterized protein n=1 Tax=Thermococcus thioreducens TaxID=277988 RepID=A0A0Q2RGP8_9EURY|nr:hypothetical protein [Thermococcus thioreducens]ASJ13371.1 hypothetical protein A3L14_10985 [Thermococcus thioreducens]KQH83222.1 hypothetical protein AMR53_00625 [Thermococcus thioreducens]SEW23400.1 hypothetical protein SAMN05216170_2305 [Thermococcus thioreducens]
MKAAARAIVVLFLTLSLIIPKVTTAATIDIRDTSEDNGGLVLISNETWESIVRILTSNGEPFSLSNIPGATSINVSARFVDDTGNTLDMTGDGISDVWMYSEDSSTPGLWRANITLGNVEPGIYTLKITAVAKDNTSQILDQAELTEEVFVLGGPYVIQFFNVKDNEHLELGNLEIRIGALSDLGSIISIGNLTNTLTIKDNNHDGIWGQRIDLNNDGTFDGWITFLKNENSYDMVFFSNNATLLEALMPQESFKISGDTITFTNRILRETRDYRNFNYYTQILWDTSLLAKLGIKAVDYYIIPYSTNDNWKITQFWNGRILAAVMKVKIIKRTSYLGLFSGEEVILDGNIWTPTTKNVDELTLKPKAILWSWYRNRGEGVIWKAAVDITAPSHYAIKSRQGWSATEFRGDNPLDGLNWLSRQLSKDKIDWWKLLGGDGE